MGKYYLANTKCMTANFCVSDGTLYRIRQGSDPVNIIWMDVNETFTSNAPVYSSVICIIFNEFSFNAHIMTPSVDRGGERTAQVLAYSIKTCRTRRLTVFTG